MNNDKKKKTVQWICSIFLFLVALSSLSAKSFPGFLFFILTGVFISPLRNKFFEILEIPILKMKYVLTIGATMFLLSTIVMSATADISNNSLQSTQSLSNQELTVSLVSQPDTGVAIGTVNENKQEKKQDNNASVTNIDSSTIVSNVKDSVTSTSEDVETSVGNSNNDTLETATATAINETSDENSNSSTVATVSEPEVQQVVVADTNSLEVHITKTGLKYHSAGCQYLRSSDIITTLGEAKALGLTPCSKCNPPQ